MATINGSIILIALPDIFRGIGVNPLLPGNASLLLWLILGYLLVTAVLVVTFGRLGDMFGRVLIYTLGFAVFTVFSILLGVTWLHGTAGALWLIAMRILQAVGGAMLLANAAAILHRRLPRRAPRHGAGPQPGRRDRRPVRRSPTGRPSRPGGVAPGVPGVAVSLLRGRTYVHGDPPMPRQAHDGESRQQPPARSSPPLTHARLQQAGAPPLQAWVTPRIPRLHAQHRPVDYTRTVPRQPSLTCCHAGPYGRKRLPVCAEPSWAHRVQCDSYPAPDNRHPPPALWAAVRARRSRARSAGASPPHTPCWPMSQCRSVSAQHHRVITGPPLPMLMDVARHPKR